MNREFLKNLLKNIQDEAEIKQIIDVIMAEHGKTIENLKCDKESVETQLKNTEAQLETAQSTIKDLKKSNADNEELQRQIDDFQTAITNLKKEHEAEVTKLARTNIENELLTKYKAKNNTAAKALVGEIEAKDNETYKTLFEAKLKELSEAEGTSFAFGQPEVKTSYNPSSGGGSAIKNPFAKETFNLTEQGKMLRDNPTQARELAASAGITL